jgi:Putative metallopeptidase
MIRHMLFALGAGVVLSQASAAAQSFDASNGEQDAYVQGNLLFLTYHEVGHLLIDQLLDADQHADRRAAEEAADDIATWLMMPDPDEAAQNEEIWSAMQGWLRSANLQTAPSQSPHYPDDAERASRIACYLYGSNPGLYPEFAQVFSVTIESVDCAEEAEALHADLEDWFGEHVATPGAASGGAVTVRYESANWRLAAARSYLMQTRVLEDTAEDITQFVRLPSDVTLVARSCGVGAAEFRYNPAARQITACYEAVDWFMRDANDELQERAGLQEGESAANGELGSGGARVTRRPRPRRP